MSFASGTAVADREGGAAVEISGDWLDACCWRCGADDAVPDLGGRFLCPSCRAELSDTPPGASEDPLRVGLGAYWEAHAMECCWRCVTGSVDPADEIGLCRRCRDELRAAKADVRGDP